MVCLRLRGWKGRSNRGPTTTLQQRHCPTVMATVEETVPEISSPSEKTEPATGTEKRFKFLCSYGGKILPNPSDGQLKYVGGETRVFCVLRSVSFLDLKKKIEDLFMVGDIMIKYRLMSEDLDTLISIRCNEDLVHMWDEYDRILSLGSSVTSAPRFLRLFLFPSFRSTSLRRSRRYLDAVNCQHMDPIPNCNLELSREYHHHHHHTECHCDDSSLSTEQSAEFPGASCVVPSPRFKEVHRVWSTPNLQGTHQAGENGTGVSSQAQCGHVYRNHVQQSGHSHRQTAFGMSETCGYQNARPQPLQNIERPPIRAPSYQNLNISCQKGFLVGDRGRSSLVQSPKSAMNGNGAQNPIPNNLTHSNIPKTEKTNSVGVHKPMHNGVYAQNLNPVPNSTSEQNLAQDYAGACGSVGTAGTKHVPPELGSVLYLQHSRSGPATPGGRRSKAGTFFQMAVDEQ